MVTSLSISLVSSTPHRSQSVCPPYAGSLQRKPLLRVHLYVGTIARVSQAFDNIHLAFFDNLILRLGANLRL